ncbi:transmembrane protein 59 isoform X2 [Anabrus simplex]|uniref:transmembrane protein 59 isoform X2 n=1 Tax=Anabrus simplex TaxID=316456 RepID=UPI0034DD5465
MMKIKLFIGLFMLLFIEYVESDIFYDVLSKIDPCESLCDKSYPANTPENAKHSSCCCVGCRFFNLIHLAEDREVLDLNNTKDDCQASCMEAYSHTKERYACNIGCACMAKLKQTQAMIPQISWSMYVEDGNSILMLQPVDFEPDDVLTDPGLRRQLEFSVAGGKVSRLPETHVRTLPVDDLGDRGDGSRVHGGSDWLDCAARKVGLPRMVLAGLVVFAILLAIWLCLCSDRRGGHVEYIPATSAGVKEPLDLPPKYTPLVNEV